MAIDRAEILAVLDRCAEAYCFPMLDNGYVYPAAARLTLHRSEADWAVVIETFGYSPRAGLPDTTISTFASTLHARDDPKQYVSREAYRRYLADHPHDEYRSAWPLEDGPWQDGEQVAADAVELLVRGLAVRLPALEEYARFGIALEEPPRVQVFELCRWLAATQREAVLATVAERRASLGGGVVQILQLEDWQHPDLADDERPSATEAFQQMADVLSTGGASRYRPREEPNTHWRHWPGGGRL